MTRGAIHALLVGIDRYEPPRFSNGLPVPPLAGAVNDVIRFRRFLEEGPFGVPRLHVRQLVSPHPWIEPPPESDAPPTRLGLLREFRGLGERAARGDQVLIHFSGHGARLPTAVPRLKGRGARDECLAPRDAGAEEGGFLRDVEIHVLLGELAAKGLWVTLVADCCHSGGVARAPAGTRVRGLGDLPFAPPEASPLGPWSTLEGRLEGSASRDAPPPEGVRWLRADPGSLPIPERCVLLAACHPTELAHEVPMEGGLGGLLTRHLVRALGETRAGATYRQVHHRMRARLRDRTPRQTPALRGDGDRFVLGWEGAPSGGAGHRWPAPEAGERLSGVLSADLFGLERIESWWCSRSRRAVDRENVPVGTLLCLLLRNDSERELEVVVLDRRGDGTTVPLHPFPGHGDSSPLPSESEQPVFFRAELPDGAEVGADRIEVLLATEPMTHEQAVDPPAGVERALALDLTIRRPPGS